MVANLFSFRKLDHGRDLIGVILALVIAVALIPEENPIESYMTAAQRSVIIPAPIIL